MSLNFPTPNSTPVERVCYTIEVPDEPLWRWALLGAISLLNIPRNWEKYGELEPEEAAEDFLPIYFESTENFGACIVPIGAINAFATEDLPDGWLLCDGTIFNDVDYPDLFAVIDNTLKLGNQFQVPDLRDRFVRGTDVSGLATGGQDEVNLTVGQLPPHTHPAEINLSVFSAAAGAPIVVQNSTLGNTGSTGNGEAVPTLPEYMAIRYAIRAT